MAAKFRATTIRIIRIKGAMPPNWPRIDGSFPGTYFEGGVLRKTTCCPYEWNYVAHQQPQPVLFGQYLGFWTRLKNLLLGGAGTTRILSLLAELLQPYSSSVACDGFGSLMACFGSPFPRKWIWGRGRFRPLNFHFWHLFVLKQNQQAKHKKNRETENTNTPNGEDGINGIEGPLALVGSSDIGGVAFKVPETSISIPTGSYQNWPEKRRPPFKIGSFP